MDSQEKSAASVQNESAEIQPKKAEKPQKSAKVLDGPTELYRHFDAWGRLLYVGVSLSSLTRLSDHRAECSWFKLIRLITVEPFPSRAIALSAEREAIEKEKPFFNRQHRRGWKDVRWSHGDCAQYGRDISNLIKFGAQKRAAKAK